MKSWIIALPFLVCCSQSFQPLFLQESTPTASGLSDYTVFRIEDADGASDWVKDLELDGAKAFRPPGQLITTPPKVLVLYGSLRERSYSRLLAYEFARILELLGKQASSYLNSAVRTLKGG